MEALAGTVLGRWYVTIFGVSFAVFAVRHMGWRKTLIYAAVAIGVGIVAENGAVRYGLPYGYYRFNPSLRGDEIWVGDVPLMVSLSYTFMAYFAFAAARLLVGGPYRTRSRWPVMEYSMAVMLAVWALWVIDPISRLGRHFFLGELFQYEGPGFWFGLPLRSQLGFALTSVVLVGVLTWMMRDESEAPVAQLREHPRLPALITYAGQVLFMTFTAIWVGRQGVAQADALAGATFIIAVPFLLMTAVYWRSLRAASRPDGDSSTERERSAPALR